MARRSFAAFLLVAAVACSEARRDPAASTTAAPATAAAGRTSGPADRDPPTLTVTAPARAAVTTAAGVVVEGTVTDPSGVSYLVIDGTPVTPDATGRFAHPVTLWSGLNVIELAAADTLGNTTRQALPVLAGAFQPEGRAVPEALAVRLNRPAFAAIERLAAQQLGGVSLATMIMARNPLYVGGATGVTVQVDALGASFGTPRLQLDPRQGGLGVHVELPAIDVTTRAMGRLLGIPYALQVRTTADRAVVDATAVVVVGPTGGVTTSLSGTRVSLDNFRFDIPRVPTFLESLARNAVRRLIERQIVAQVEQVIPDQVNRALAGAITPVTRLVMGVPITFTATPRQISFDPLGARAVISADVSAPPAAGLPTTPGSLATAGAAPRFGTARAFHAGVDDDLINKVAHAAWRAGLLSQRVDASRAAQLGLPAWLPLDAYLLQVFFPSLIGRLNPADPLEFELSAALPPVVTALPAPDLLEAALGELTVSIYVAPAGRPRELVLQVATQARMDLAVQVSAAGLLGFSIQGRPTVQSDVVATPVAPLDDLAVETFLNFVLPPVLQLVPRAFAGVPLPGVAGLNPTGLDFHADGPAGDYLAVEGDL